MIHAGNGLTWRQVTIEIAGNQTTHLKAHGQDGTHTFSRRTKFSREHPLGILMTLAAQGEWRNPELCLPHVLSLRFPGVDSEAIMVALKDVAAISNGSACTSSSYQPSHVLKAMGMSDDEANECVRISWCHLTPEVDWEEIADRIRALR